MDSQDLQRLKNKYDIIGNDAALNRALEVAGTVAPTDLTVLVTGESGAGKENIPKIIHQNSRRKNGKYFAVNCGAIPEGTIDSELFGHVKGAFTGAVETRKGYFEEANGGTLFLDEIGELPLATQAKLLRVLQDGEYIKVGASKVEKTDVRVIAATNVDLLHAIGRGKFREDLYYRLDAIQIKMPALRERKADIELFFRKFSSDFSERFSLSRIALSHDAVELLTSYRWPGNIRQLKNVAETVTALEAEPASPTVRRREIDAATLSRYMPSGEESLLPVLAGPAGGNGDTMSDADRQMFIKAILDLKQDVESLKGAVFGKPDAGATLPLTGPEPVREEPDWQAEEPMAPAAEAPRRIVEIAPEAYETPSESGPGPKDSPRKTLEEQEVEIVRDALARHDGNRKKVAEELGLSERTLYRWIDKYHLEAKD